jgi:hypothetical protein
LQSSGCIAATARISQQLGICLLNPHSKRSGISTKRKEKRRKKSYGAFGSGRPEEPQCKLCRIGFESTLHHSHCGFKVCAKQSLTGASGMSSTLNKENRMRKRLVRRMRRMYMSGIRSGNGGSVTCGQHFF